MTEENEKEIEDTSLVKTEESSISMAKAEETEIDDVNDDDIHDEDDADDFSDNDDDQIKEHDSDELNHLDIDALYEKAKECLVLTPRDALGRLKAIRPIFFEAYQSLKKSELEKLSEEEIDGFKFEKAPLAEGFNQLLATAKAAIGEERKRIESEKENNYKHKLALLEMLSVLVSEDETENSISKVKEIQKEWKSIKVIPKDKTQELWDRYHMLLDKFYDNHSINIELKELDRKKNLEAKIELTKKVEEIANEKSLKRSFLNQ